MSEQRDVVLTGQRLQQADTVRNQWVVTVPEGVEVDDVLQKAFWAYVADKLHAYDRIEVRTDLDEWVADLVVLRCDRTWALVKLLGLHKLDGAPSVPEADSVDHIVSWKGHIRRWAVIRKSDSAVVQESLQTKLDALAWLKNHEAVTA